MTTREQAIEIAAKAHAEYDILRWRIEAEDSDEELPSGGVFGAIADALLAAGVIPAEGMVAVDANVANKIVRMWDARANLRTIQTKNARRLATSQSACDEVNRAGFSWQAAWEAITDDDIDAFRAIPDAPTGEGKR